MLGGKSILLDVRTGRPRVAERLIRWADVITINAPRRRSSLRTVAGADLAAAAAGQSSSSSSILMPPARLRSERSLSAGRRRRCAGYDDAPDAGPWASGGGWRSWSTRTSAPSTGGRLRGSLRHATDPRIRQWFNTRRSESGGSEDEKRVDLASNDVVAVTSSRRPETSSGRSLRDGDIDDRQQQRQPTARPRPAPESAHPLDECDGEHELGRLGRWEYGREAEAANKRGRRPIDPRPLGRRGHDGNGDGTATATTWQ